MNLHEEMDRTVPHDVYPPGVIPDDRIQGTAFFPGGSGLYLENHSAGEIDFPFGGLMLLGHNFDSETNFRRSQRNGKERLTQGTWRRLCHPKAGPCVHHHFNLFHDVQGVVRSEGIFSGKLLILLKEGVVRLHGINAGKLLIC